jgi:dTDP-4-amino-4,6-dideoxygalactose transaminase
VQERDRVRAELAERGIESSIHYPIPCHQLEPYAQYQHEALPVAEAAAREILSLPLYPHITNQQVDRVIEALLVSADLRAASRVG